MMDYHNPNDFWSPGDPDLYKDLEDDERIAATIFHIAGMAICFVIMLGLCAMCSSCTTTQYIPVIEHHTDTLIQTKIQKDSIYVHDSVTVQQRGDTVWVDRWHTKWVNHLERDTTYISKTDTVPKPYPVETIKEVPAKLTWWQQTRLHLANIVLWLLALLAVIYVGKKHLSRLGQD